LAVLFIPILADDGFYDFGLPSVSSHDSGISKEIRFSLKKKRKKELKIFSVKSAGD